ncbi:MAG TPA: TolC family outer membrane protein [Novosphingobium sp.]
MPVAPAAADPATEKPAEPAVQRPLTAFRPSYPYSPQANAAAGPVAPVASLTDAIALAYRNNPTLLSQRAALRSIDNRYPQARAAYLPTLDITATTGYTHDRNDSPFGPTPAQHGWSNSAAAVATQSLYSFGRNRSSENVALAEIAYQRELLRSSETEVMLAVVSDYVEVIRDAEAVTIAAQNEAILAREYDEDKTRYRVREITSTDFQQVESRLEAARAGLLSAKAQLAASQSRFLRDVGAPPGELARPDVLQVPATTLDSVLAVAEADSPIVRQAQAKEKISRASREAAFAEDMPRVDARGTAEVGSLSPYSNTYRTRRLQGEFVLTVPLLDGGRRAARIAEAAESNQADWLEIEAAVRSTRGTVTEAWNQLAGARASLVHYLAAVASAREAFEGARIQERAGARTTLDVLDLARDLLIQQTNYNTALANEYLFRANLIAAMGRLEAPKLVPSVQRYDAEAHFEKVRGRSDLPLFSPLLSSLDGVTGGGIAKDRPLGDPASKVTPRPALSLPAESVIPAEAPTDDLTGSR